MKYIASCSFGKDSLAMILTIIKHGLPLDEVIYCEVMFDEQISGEYPEHAAFIHNKAIPILELCYGLKVTVLRDKTTYKENCYHIRTLSNTLRAPKNEWRSQQNTRCLWEPGLITTSKMGLVGGG